MIESRGRRNIGRQLPLAALVIALLLIASAALVGITRAGSLLGVPSGATQQKTTGGSKVTAELAQKFAEAGPDAKLHYWVVMADQADTSNNIPNSQWAEKGWYVYNVLTKKAADTQGPVISQIAQLTTAGSVTSYQSFWIINLVAVTGNLESANTLSSIDGVGEVRVAPTGQIHGDVQGQLSDSAYAAIDQAAKDIQESQKGSPLLAPLSPLAIQHNINEVHAPQGWALGYDGTGITVGSMDTGTRWTHEALNARYRGNVAPPDPSNIHDYNWLDGYGTFTTPTDNNGHGSHTMGTILGTSPNATYGNIGVGKGAMWITVRICATSSCDDIPIMNGFQWTLAPTRVDGTQANPAYRPRVSNNSWGGSGCDTGFDTAVANWVNAGIFPDFSTGNSGPGAGTVGTPASSPKSWGTGNLATNNANWVINTGSSRGPSACDPDYPLRPFAVAPGTLICSSINTSDTSYSCGYTGTSMAAPHIAGAVAMLLSKNSSLSIAQLRNAITGTTFFSPTWGTQPNNNYGYGLLQVDAALNSVSGGPTATPTSAPPTNTAVPTNTPGPGTPSATPTACTLQFADVPTGSTFYANIHCLACRGIINGYPCGGAGEPCNGSNQPYFRPSNSITRGQLAKVVSQSAGYTDPVTTQAFEDVAPGTTFYDYVGRLAIHDVMGGYACGGPGEPCGSGNLPYFRPGANATRGQLTKIVSNAAGFSDPDPSTHTFTDVPSGSTFHLYVERLLINRPGAIGGYPCGGAGEPCDSESRPYFRPSNTLTRGQTSKIISNVFFPGCETPGKPVGVSLK